MNPRHESWLERALVRLAIDPALRARQVRARLKSNVQGGSGLVQLALRHLVDPTIIPPPSYTRERADAVYGDALRRAVEYLVGTRVPGDVLEFGTFLGYTARWLACLMRDLDVAGDLWLYDSFEGLPPPSDVDRGSYEAGVWVEGAMRVDPDIHLRIGRSIGRLLPPGRVHVVKGYFEHTLPANLPARRAALVHVDCDLYASTRFVLSTLLERDLLQDGTVVLFDDFNCNRASPDMGERRALREVLSGQTRWSADPWFSYGWHGQAYLVHERR